MSARYHFGLVFLMVVTNPVARAYDSAGGNFSGGLQQDCLLINDRLDELNKARHAMDFFGKCAVYYELGRQYEENNEYSKALECYARGLFLADSVGLINYELAFNNKIGKFWFENEYYLKAQPYFRRVLSLSEELGNQEGMHAAYQNLGIIYGALNQHDQASLYFQESLRYAGSDDPDYMAPLYLNIGENLFIRGYYDSALMYINRCIEPLEHDMEVTGPEGYDRMNRWKIIAEAYYLLGKFHMHQERVNAGLSYLDSSMVLARKAGHFRLIRDMADTKVSYYNESGLVDSVLFYLNLYKEVNDSISNQNRQLIAQLASVDVELEQRRQQAEQRQRSRYLKVLMYSFIVVSVLVMVIAVFIYRSYRHKQKANRLLSEIDQLKTRMYTNISHELRTPLTLILGPLEDMMAKDAVKRPTARTVEMMQRNANRLLNLVNQILDLSRLDAGSLKLELQQGDIMEEFRLIIHSFSSKAEKKKIEFSHLLEPSVFHTWFDSDKLDKILSNLLSNAFKFTPDGGCIRVEGKVRFGVRSPFGVKDHDLLVLTVSDTGKGIPPGKADRIFERFYQLAQSGPTDQAGTGIGLALTKELAEMMHGKISVESEPDRGSTFVIEIPLGKDHLSEAEYSITKSPAAHRGMAEEEGEGEVFTETGEFAGDADQPLILVVDDHADIRALIRGHMEKDFRVVEADNGITGAEKAFNCIPDLIVADLMMPGRDGVEMTRILKTDERTSHIPIIMLTARASVEDRIEGLETGADDYLTKPFHMKVLRVRIENLVEQRKKLREKYRRELILEPRQIAINSTDERFLAKTMDLIEKNLADPDFNIGKMYTELGMSRMQLFRKTRALSGQSPNELIRTFRLKRAAQLLEQKYGNVAEVTYEVGFNNLSYFAKCFREMYGVNPSDYMNKS